jgi:hypothetical protein
MSELADKQRRFTWMTGQLIAFAFGNGMALRYGCARCVQAGHHKANSLHYEGLAVDFNLDIRGPDGAWHYCADTAAHKILGEYWETLGGSWGGRFEDGNHYSIEHEGRR